MTRDKRKNGEEMAEREERGERAEETGESWIRDSSWCASAMAALIAMSCVVLIQLTVYQLQCHSARIVLRLALATGMKKG
jgi:hypothetical protein